MRERIFKVNNREIGACTYSVQARCPSCGTYTRYPLSDTKGACDPILQVSVDEANIGYPCSECGDHLVIDQVRAYNIFEN